MIKLIFTYIFYLIESYYFLKKIQFNYFLYTKSSLPFILKLFSFLLFIFFSSFSPFISHHLSSSYFIFL